MTHYGADVASQQHANGGIAWNALYAYLHNKGGGQPFVVVKVTEGTGYVNPFAGADIAAAKAAGFAVAGYEFNHPGLTAGSQASYARAHDPGNLPVFEDEEVTDAQSAATVASEGMEFLSVMGPGDLFYSYPAFIDSNGIHVPQGQLWLADPNHPLGQPSRPCVIHQGQPTTMPGISGLVDPDVFMGSEADFARIFGGPTTLSLPGTPEVAMYDPKGHCVALIKPDGSVATYNADGSPGGHYLGGLNNHPAYNAGAGKPEGPAVAITPWDDGLSPWSGYLIWTQDAQGIFHPYSFPSDGRHAAANA